MALTFKGQATDFDTDASGGLGVSTITPSASIAALTGKNWIFLVYMQIQTNGDTPDVNLTGPTLTLNGVNVPLTLAGSGVYWGKTAADVSGVTATVSFTYTEDGIPATGAPDYDPAVFSGDLLGSIQLLAFADALQITPLFSTPVYPAGTAFQLSQIGSRQPSMLVSLGVELLADPTGWTVTTTTPAQTKYNSYSTYAGLTCGPVATVTTITSSNATRTLGFTNSGDGVINAIEIQEAPTNTAGLAIVEGGAYQIDIEYQSTGATNAAAVVKAIKTTAGVDTNLPNIGFSVPVNYNSQIPISSQGMFTLAAGDLIRCTCDGTNGQALTGKLKLSLQRLS